MNREVSRWRNINAGDRIELVYNNDPSSSIKAGTQGTFLKAVLIERVGTQLHVRWDDKTASILVPEAGDEIRKAD